MIYRFLRQIDVALRSRDETEPNREQRLLEMILITVVIGIMALLDSAPHYQSVVLNLYFLPVALSGFYLGRYRAGVMALFCVISAAFTVGWGVFRPIGGTVELVEFLSLMVWAGVLGLTALVIGTLSDDRNREIERLHETHRADTLSDSLTGVANRRAFEYELRRRLAEWNRLGTPFSLVLIDIDHFKKFNDTYGHQAGDEVLRSVAVELSKVVREMDLVARYGGEEFAVIMPNTASRDAKEVAERARYQIEKARFPVDGLILKLTVSVGLAQVMSEESNEALVDRADAALYTSKQLGRNCAHFHNGATCEHFGAALPSKSVHDLANSKTRTPRNTYTDQVTGLPTRTVFVEELKRRLKEYTRYDGSMSLMLVQLDAFDDPAEAARFPLENVTAVLAEFVRNMMRDADLVARYDDQQFAILMPCTPLEGAVTPAERLRMCVAECQHLKVNGHPLRMTVSVGLTSSTRLDDSSKVLLRAERALQTAVEKGGNRCYYTDVATDGLLAASPLAPDTSLTIDVVPPQDATPPGVS